MKKGWVVLESGGVFEGEWLGGQPQAGELVFNTSHFGYEEISTDPSYFNQIVIMTSPMQGNYGVTPSDWESKKPHISGFVALDIQNSFRDHEWIKTLSYFGTPILQGVDTRKIVLSIRSLGATWGALVDDPTQEGAFVKAKALIQEKKKVDEDWPNLVSRKSLEIRRGTVSNGPRVAIIDYGCKENIVREVAAISSEVGIFPSRTTAREIQDWAPHGILLSNGPGDPEKVQQSLETIKGLLGWRPIFGICMGHQLLSLALGARTFKMPFGHRGGNHPVRDELLKQIYMTSQNHGYAVKSETIPSGVRVTHTNLYDGTVEGIECFEKKCFSVQYHPESHPGPNEASQLFGFFRNLLT